MVKQLKDRMQEAAEKLDFERAAVNRNQISALEKVLEKQKVVSADMIDQDIIAWPGAAVLYASGVLHKEGETDKP